MTQTVDEFVEANGGKGFLELPRVAELVEIAHNLEKLWIDASEQESSMRKELKEVGDRRFLKEIYKRERTRLRSRLKSIEADIERRVELRVGIRIATLTAALAKARYDLYEERRKRRAA